MLTNLQRHLTSTTWTLLTLSAFTLAAATLIADDKAEADSAAAVADVDFEYDGIWKPRGAILNGDFLPPPVLETITLTIKGDRYEVTVEGEDHSDSGKYLVDDLSNPKRMMIKSMSGPNKGKTFYAIYEIKNADAMRVCYDLSGKDFPDDFKAPKGSERYVVGYRRQK